MSRWDELLWLLRRRSLARRLGGDERRVTLGAEPTEPAVKPLWPGNRRSEGGRGGLVATAQEGDDAI